MRLIAHYITAPQGQLSSRVLVHRAFLADRIVSIQGASYWGSIERNISPTEDRACCMQVRSFATSAHSTATPPPANQRGTNLGNCKKNMQYPNTSFGTSHLHSAHIICKARQGPKHAPRHNYKAPALHKAS